MTSSGENITTTIVATTRKAVAGYVQAISALHPSAVAVLADVADVGGGRADGHQHARNEGAEGSFQNGNRVETARQTSGEHCQPAAEAGKQHAARAMGISVDLVRFLTTTVGGFLAGENGIERCQFPPIVLQL